MDENYEKACLRARKIRLENDIAKLKVKLAETEENLSDTMVKLKKIGS